MDSRLALTILWLTGDLVEPKDLMTPLLEELAQQEVLQADLQQENRTFMKKT